MSSRLPGIGWHALCGLARRREYVWVGDASADSLHRPADAAAASFVLPGSGPDVNRAVKYTANSSSWRTVIAYASA
jgi:hypothetical protein